MTVDRSILRAIHHDAEAMVDAYSSALTLELLSDEEIAEIGVTVGDALVLLEGLLREYQLDKRQSELVLALIAGIIYYRDDEDLEE